MNSRVLKLTIVLLAGLLLLGTAGAVSADVGTLGINLSTGEITGTDTTYTGYVEFTPNASADFPLNSFRIVIQSEDPQVKLADSAKVDGLFTGHEYFDYVPMRKGTINDTYTFTANLAGTKDVYNVSLSAGETYKILPFTISAPSSVTNVTVNLSFISDALDCYVGSFYLTGTGSKSDTHVLGSDLANVTYMLDNETANSIKPESVVYVDIETNETVFDGNVSVFSELVKVIANSSDKYFLNYTSSNEDVIKFYNYNNESLNMTPRYVVLKGSNYSVITVNLTDNVSKTVIDSKTFTVQTKKIDITADMFNFTANHTYGYSEGVSVGPQVLNHVKESLLNHSIGAADSTDDAYTYGYVRDIGKITLTFFNSTGDEVVPIEGGVYSFNVSVAANDNYNEAVDLKIANNTFAIDGAVIRGICTPLNKSYFNATTPAKMTVEFNAIGMDFNTSVFDRNTTVSEYIYFNAHYNLSFNQSASNYTVDNVNVSILDGNRTISFKNESIKPDHVVTYFVFDGFPRGDVSLNGAVRGNDASLLAWYLVDYSGSTSDVLTEEQKFYANVKGSEKLSGNDVRLIAQYAAGYVDADYR